MKITSETNFLLKGTSPSADQNKEKQLRKAASDFEAIIFQKILKQMRDSIPKGGLFDGGQAEDIYRSMLDEQMAKAMSQSKGKGIGLGEMLYQQMTKRL